MPVNGDDDALMVNAELVGGGVDDATIGLMRHEPVDIGASQPRLLEGVPDRLRQIDDGVAEDLLALHAQEADGLGRTRAAIDIELVLVAAIRADMGRQHAAIGERALAGAGFQHDRAGAVAEEDASGAVLPVEDAREGLRTDDERGLGGARGQELVGRREREDEARADSLEIEGDTAIDAERGLDLRRGRGKV